MAREMQEKKLQQELERQKEEDEQKKKFRKPKQGPAKEDAPLKKSQTASRQVATFTCSLPRGKSRGISHCNQAFDLAHFPSRKLT